MEAPVDIKVAPPTNEAPAAPERRVPAERQKAEISDLSQTVLNRRLLELRKSMKENPDKASEILADGNVQKLFLIQRFKEISTGDSSNLEASPLVLREGEEVIAIEGADTPDLKCRVKITLDSDSIKYEDRLISREDLATAQLTSEADAILENFTGAERNILDLWKKTQINPDEFEGMDPNQMDQASKEAADLTGSLTIDDLKAFLEKRGEPTSAEPKPPTLTTEAEDVISKVDEGGVPTAVTENLARILRENGIAEEDISSKTPNELIDMLRLKKTESEATPTDATGERIEGILKGKNIVDAEALSLIFEGEDLDGQTKILSDKIVELEEKAKNNPDNISIKSDLAKAIRQKELIGRTSQLIKDKDIVSKYFENFINGKITKELAGKMKDAIRGGNLVLTALALTPELDDNPNDTEEERKAKHDKREKVKDALFLSSAGTSLIAALLGAILIAMGRELSQDLLR